MNIFITDCKNAFRYLGWTIIRPKQSFESLKSEKRQVVYSIYSFLFMLTFYTAILIIGGFFVDYEPILPFIITIKGVPNDSAYLHVAYITFPVITVLLLTCASLIELVRLVFKSTFESYYTTFSTTAYCITISMWVGFICDVIIIGLSFFFMSDKFPVWAMVLTLIFYILMFAWMAVLMPIAVKVTKNLPWFPAIITGSSATLFFWTGIALFAG